MIGEAPRCPVCRASFRGTAACSRCGADLAPLMVLAAKAHLLRRAARDVLRAGDFARAGDLAAEAQRLCATEAGSGLTLLARWLIESRPVPVPRSARG
ncbi:MAG: hypothetical protein JXP34_28645 [Planctomycetes bacterium]|nr:hypothetical protein [Planctomycetota bacterium]